jgi:hypothetical protein
MEKEMKLDKRSVEGMCFDCKFWYTENTPITTGCGECRYGPPTALPIFGRFDNHTAAFPYVSEYEWCWRFERK